MPALRRTECPLFDLRKNFLRRTVRLSKEEQVALLAAVAANPPGSAERIAARNELAAGWYPAIERMARRWSRDRDDNFLEDMIQVAGIGLLRAIEDFDESRGFQLSTLAWKYMACACRQEREAMAHVAGTRRMAQALAECGRAEGRFYAVYGRWPNNEELAELTGLGVSTIQKALRLRKTIRCDYRKTPDSRAFELSAPPEEARPETDDSLFDLMARLRERDREVVQRRYGFDGKPESLEEVGDLLGLSKERVRQIEERAINELRTFASGNRRMVADYGRPLPVKQTAAQRHYAKQRASPKAPAV